jgi:anti-anti-sigma factor
MTIERSETQPTADVAGFARVLFRTPGGVSVVALSGELTAATAPMLRTALIDTLGGGGPRLVLDLGAVRSCAPEAVHAISLAAGRALRRGGALRLAAVPARLAPCFDSVAHVGAAFDHVSEALAAPWWVASALSTAG